LQNSNSYDGLNALLSNGGVNAELPWITDMRAWIFDHDYIVIQLLDCLNFQINIHGSASTRSQFRQGYNDFFISSLHHEVCFAMRGSIEQRRRLQMGKKRQLPGNLLTSEGMIHGL
ncbi:MAG: hypothetical protein ACTSP0_00555, partial [Alphaproteobacteria bacterium]